MGLGLGVIPMAVFILAFAGTWSVREAFNETIWFGGGWLGALSIIYLFDAAGYGFLSTSPMGPGGGVALIFGFGAMYYRRYRWRKDQAEKRRLQAEERARQAASGAAPSTSFLGNVGRGMGRAVHSYRTPKGK